MKYQKPEVDQSAAIAVASVIANLLNRHFQFNSVEEQLVLEAIRRSTTKLENASLEEIADYIGGMNDASLIGFGNNVKGIYHELSFILAENTDGDDVTAEIYAATNHPGADVKFIQDGEIVGEVQLKATDGLRIIKNHFDKYPDIPVWATNEAAVLDDRVFESGFQDAELENDVRETLDDLKDQSILNGAEFVAGSAGLLSAVSQARAVLSGEKTIDDAAVQTLQDTTLAVSTSFLVDLMFS